MASIDFHILFQNGRAKDALERYGEIFDDYELDRLDPASIYRCPRRSVDQGRTVSNSTSGPTNGYRARRCFTG